MNAGTSADWESLFGTSLPPRLTHIAAHAVAWQQQVLVHGDISAAIARDLRVVASEVLCARSKPKPSRHAESVEGSRTPRASIAKRSPPRDTRRALPTASSQLVPGTRLVKAHGGRNHVVEVLADGFIYEEQRFASLSAIARHITGTHWNGLLFFGLRQRKTYPKRAHG